MHSQLVLNERLVSAELLLYPDYYLPSKVIAMLKLVDYFGPNPTLHVISPADLDFIQGEPNLKKTCYNSISNFMSKYNTLTRGSIVIFDGYELHKNVKLRHDLRNIYMDSINLESDDVRKFGKAYYINPTATHSSITYNTLISNNPKEDLDSILLSNQEYKHVILGNEGEVLEYNAYKNSIKDFNAKDTGMLYINRTPIRPFMNVDWLHIVDMPLTPDVEFTIFQLYKSILTSKPLKVMFYVREDQVDKYNKIAEHIQRHVKSGNTIHENAKEIKIVNGRWIRD